MSEYLVAAFYKFVPLPHYKSLREELLVECKKNDLRGSILLAEEGINSTISGLEPNLRAFLKYLKGLSEFADLKHKEAWSVDWPFDKMKVRLKKEIVNLGQDGVDPINLTGNHAAGEDWNELLENPNVTVIDTRNDYEVQIGTFKNAINPMTYGFTEFADWVENNLDPKKDKKVAMFCTGGIRCEKASSYMLAQGFEEVVQLDGGILQYLEDTPREKSLWQGDCFVFDHRVAVNHELEQQDYVICPGCGYVIDEKSRKLEGYEDHVSCAGCHKSLTEERRNRLRARKEQLTISS